MRGLARGIKLGANAMSIASQLQRQLVLVQQNKRLPALSHSQTTSSVIMTRLTYLSVAVALLSYGVSAAPFDPTDIPCPFEPSATPTTSTAIVVVTPTTTLIPLPVGTCAATSDVRCPASDGGKYTAKNCQDFTVECDTDRIGGDLPNNPIYPGSFAKCIDACASKANCAGIVYSGGPCYLKSTLVATNRQPGATAARKGGKSAGGAAAATPTPSASSSA